MAENAGQTRGSAIAVVKAAQMSVGSALVGAGGSVANDNSVSDKLLSDIKAQNDNQTKGIMALVDTMRSQFMFDKEAFRRQRDQARELAKEKQLAASNTNMDMSKGIGDAAKEAMSLGPLLLGGLAAVAYFARELNVDAILRLPQQIKSIRAMATFAKGVGTIATLGMGPKIIDNMKAAVNSFKLKPDAFSPKNVGILDKIKDFFKPLTNFIDNTGKAITKQIDTVKNIFTGEGKFAKSLKSFGTFFDDAFKTIQTTLKPITDTIKGLFGGNTSMLGKLLEPLKTVGRAIGKLFLPITLILGIFDGVSGFMKEYENTGSIVDGIRGAVVGIVDGFIGGFVRLLTDLLGMALEFLGLENLGQAVRNFGEDVTKFFNKAVGGIVDFVMGIFTFDGERILGGLSGMFGGVAGFFGTVLTAPINMAVNFVKDLFGWGDPGVPFDLMAEIQSAAQAAFDWIKGLFTIDFGAIKQKMFDVGLIMKAMGAGGVAAVKAIAPGGESPGEAYTRVYNETIASGTPPETEIEPAPKNRYERIQERLDRKKRPVVAQEIPNNSQPNVTIASPVNTVNNVQKSSTNTVNAVPLDTSTDKRFENENFGYGIA
jgi:hypothetical protein